MWQRLSRELNRSKFLSPWSIHGSRWREIQKKDKYVEGNNYEEKQLTGRAKGWWLGRWACHARLVEVVR